MQNFLLVYRRCFVNNNRPLELKAKAHLDRKTNKTQIENYIN